MTHQLSYVHGASDVPLIGSTIGDLLDQTANRFPDREALVSHHQKLRYTYAQLKAECDRVARSLMACGVAKGDRVGIWSPNNAEWVLIQFATAKIGSILVNVNPAYRSSELAYALKQSGCSMLILSPPYKTANYPEILREVRSQLPLLQTVITLGEERFPDCDTWKDLLSKSEEISTAELRQRQSDQNFDEPINIQYTSGTTGFPKGATLSHHSILNNGFFIAEKMRFTEQDRLCIPVPFYHCFGMVLGNLACVTHGATMVLPAETFDAAKTLEAVSEERCTALHGVPTMFIAELALPDFDRFDLTSLRTGIMAGAPCPIEVMKQVFAKMHMAEVTIAYGMTETSPVSFQSETDDPIEKRVSTVGRIHPHVECKIIEPETGKTVPRGTTGELLSRGYIVMLGYWNNPEATAAAIDEARWMHTGDLAIMDEQGYVQIVGRSKDMIIRGGENIYPREIEEFLYTHPKIQDVQVIGVPDQLYGEEVMAWVILKKGINATQEEFVADCKGKISNFKIPRYWHFTDTFPMTVSGKIQKYKLREMALAVLGLK
ncbi:MAG TPA: AMP-binding protein [Acidobacteriota bacterium]